MNQVKNLKNLSNLSYFNKNTLAQFVNLSDNSLYANISRWLKNGKIVQLKKGLYVAGDYFNRLVDKQVYLEFIANKLRFPSYLSLEYVLQKHAVLSESVFVLTSISLKSKRVYKNNLGIFVYRSIKDNLFTGYKIKNYQGFEIKEASKSKALFDFLYLKLFSIKLPTRQLIDSFRLNLDNFNAQEKHEFKKYCRLTKIKKYRNLPNLVFS